MQQVFVIIEMKKRKYSEVRKVIITQIAYEKDGKQRPVWKVIVETVWRAENSYLLCESSWMYYLDLD